MTKLKSKKEIDLMRESGRRLARTIEKVKEKAEPGMKTEELNRLAEQLIKEEGATPSFKGYKGFPAALCTSINEMVVHGIPSDKKIKKGDILSLDLGLCFNGYHADMATTIPIGKIDKKTEKLLKVTKISLQKGIEAFRVGNRLGDIGHAVQSYVEGQGFTVVEGLCGHGIGKEVHQDPQVLNIGEPGTGMEIKEGMVICIEPMVTTGNPSIKYDNEGIKTKNLSAHFEHMIAIVDGKPQILTALDTLS
jgi:methionyl aminopeptidase